MGLIHQALCRLTLPQLDPDDDPVSISLVYNSNPPVAGGPSSTTLLTAQVPNLLNVGATGASAPLCHYVSNTVDRGTNHCRIDVYDIGSHLDGTPHGSPNDSANFTLGAGSGNGLPEGVAATISYRADYGSDVEFGAPSGVETGHLRPRSRDRGRFYLGPLGQNTCSPDGTTNRIKFTSQFITDALASLQAVVQLSDVVNGDFWRLQVWSRVNHGVKDVTELWMDDRPDYQRRRADPGIKTFRSAT